MHLNKEVCSVCGESVSTLSTHHPHHHHPAITTILIILIISPATEGEDNSGHIGSFLRFQMLTMFVKTLGSTTEGTKQLINAPRAPPSGPSAPQLQDFPRSLIIITPRVRGGAREHPQTHGEHRETQKEEESTLSPSTCPPLSHRFLSGPPAADPAGASVPSRGVGLSSMEIYFKVGFTNV